MKQRKLMEQRIRLRRIKSIKFVRLMIFPYKDWKIRQEYQKYMQSEDCRKLGQLKGTHKGERCFIIGNGPSLKSKDLDRLQGEFTFAANRIYEIFPQTSWRPTIYIAGDYDFLRTEHENVCHVQSELKIFPYRYQLRNTLESNKNAIYVWWGKKRFEITETPFYADRSAYIPIDVSQGLSIGGTVTFDAMQLAIFMEFKEIYLLGVDFDYSHVLDENGIFHNAQKVSDYFTHKSYSTSYLCLAPVKYAYTVAREYCEKHDIVIRNATRGGKLEIFERVNFDSLFEKR